MEAYLNNNRKLLLQKGTFPIKSKKFQSIDEARLKQYC
jgi:hypothetical protein